MTDILEDIRRQLAGRNDVWTFEVDEIAGSAAAKLKDLAPEAAVAFAIEALRIIRDDRTWLAPVLNRCVSHVLRRKLPFTEDDVVEMIRLVSVQYKEFPYRGVLGAVESLPMSPRIADAL